MFTTGYREWERVQLNIIRAYRDAVPRGSCKAWTAPGNGNAVWCILEGCVDLFDERGGRLLHADVGDWVFKPPIRKLYQCFSDGARIISIWFELMHTPTGRPICTLNEPFSVRCADEPELGAQADGILEFARPGATISRSRPDGWELTLQEYNQLQARAHDFVAKCTELMLQNGATFICMENIDPRVVQAIQILSEFSFTGSVPYAQLLVKVGLSRVQLDRIFVQELGVTPKQHMDRQVLSKAISHLTGEDPSIKAIAFDLGFKSSAHFCSWFRRQTGVTPGNYQAH